MNNKKENESKNLFRSLGPSIATNSFLAGSHRNSNHQREDKGGKRRRRRTER